MLGKFITKEEWENLEADYPISCTVEVKGEDGITYKQGFVMDKITSVEFGKKMKACEDRLIRALLNKTS